MCIPNTIINIIDNLIVAIYLKINPYYFSRLLGDAPNATLVPQINMYYQDSDSLAPIYPNTKTIHRPFVNHRCKW